MSSDPEPIPAMALNSECMSFNADEALTQLEAAVANSVTLVIASVMEDKLPSYQAAQQDDSDKPAGE